MQLSVHQLPGLHCGKRGRTLFGQTAGERKYYWIWVSTVISSPLLFVFVTSHPCCWEKTFCLANWWERVKVLGPVMHVARDHLGGDWHVLQVGRPPCLTRPDVSPGDREMSVQLPCVFGFCAVVQLGLNRWSLFWTGTRCQLVGLGYWAYFNQQLFSPDEITFLTTQSWKGFVSLMHFLQNKCWVDAFWREFLFVRASWVGFSHVIAV